MQILLTGGAGFIGSHLAMRLMEDGHDVVVLDNFNNFYDPALKEANIKFLLSGAEAGMGHLTKEGTGGDTIILPTPTISSPPKATINPGPLPPPPHSMTGYPPTTLPLSQTRGTFELKRGDILDQPLLERICTEHRFDAVIHLAAWAGVRPSLERPLLYQQVNVEGTLKLLEMCRKFEIGKIVFASSSSVYGARPRGPFREDDPVDNPISPYAATKKAGELLGYTYHHLYGISVSCLRFFTVYGPRQRPEMAIHKFARLMAQGKPIPLFGDGNSARDYTYVDDIVDGTVRALNHCRGYHLYNLGNSSTVRLNDLVLLLGSHLGISPKVEYHPSQPGDVPITYADISRARDELGYKASTPIQEGLKRFAEWFMAEGILHISNSK